MLNSTNPTSTAAWQRLAQHYQSISSLHMRDLFKADPGRFDRFSIRFNDILVDYSKNIITPETLDLLMDLAVECGLAEAIEAMFTGPMWNSVDNRI